MKYEDVLSHISELKIKRHITNHNLADMCHVSDSTMSRILNGQITMSISMALDMAKAFDVPVSELFGETVEAPKEASEKVVTTEAIRISADRIVCAMKSCCTISAVAMVISAILVRRRKG